MVFRASVQFEPTTVPGVVHSAHGRQLVLVFGSQNPGRQPQSYPVEQINDGVMGRSTGSHHTCAGWDVIGARHVAPASDTITGIDICPTP